MKNLSNLAELALLEAEGDLKAAISALECGEWLGSIGASQEEAEEAHSHIKSLLLKGLVE